MSSWVRSHKDGDIRVLVIEQRNGSFVITIVEPNGEQRAP
jgi:hypothetical protein